MRLLTALEMRSRKYTKGYIYHTSIPKLSKSKPKKTTLMSLYWYRTVFLKTRHYEKLNLKISATWNTSNFKKAVASNLHNDQRIIE